MEEKERENQLISIITMIKSTPLSYKSVYDKPLLKKAILLKDNLRK